jgi:hypothetical protein
VETWIDLDRGLVRQQVGDGETRGSWALLISRGTQRVRYGNPAADKDGPARDCLLTGIAASLVAPCTRSREAARTVAPTARDGRPMLVLRSDLAHSTKKISITGTGRIWVDPTTWFPVSLTSKAKATTRNDVVRVHTTATETHEFVAAESLPADFFTAASVTAWADHAYSSTHSRA